MWSFLDISPSHNRDIYRVNQLSTVRILRDLSGDQLRRPNTLRLQCFTGFADRLAYGCVDLPGYCTELTNSWVRSVRYMVDHVLTHPHNRSTVYSTLTH